MNSGKEPEEDKNIVWSNTPIDVYIMSISFDFQQVKTEACGALTDFPS